MERFSILFLSRPAPGAQLWFYPHLCMWATYRSLLPRLPWSTWVCPGEDWAWRWHSCLDHGSPGGTRCTGKPATTEARDNGPSGRLFLVPGCRHARISPGRAFSIAWRQVLTCGESEVTVVALPPACDSAVAPCFRGSPVFLHRHSLLRISSLLSPQAVSLQPTAFLTLGLLSNPHAPAPSPCAHQWTHIPIQGT